MSKLIVAESIAYMLKILKSNKKITKYKDEFASIRHGNYYEFINKIRVYLPENSIVISDRNGFNTNVYPQKDEVDFILIIKAGDALKTFYKNCFTIYGQISDVDISDEIYYKLALYELNLRIHANNNQLLNGKEKISVVIDKICKLKGFSQIEKDILNKGNKFLNMVKHYNNQFPSWIDGISAFEIAYQFLVDKELTIL